MDVKAVKSKNNPMKSNNSINRESKNSSRGVALQILKEINHDGSYANISLKRHLKNSSLTERDIAFVSRLVYGTLEKQFTIDLILEKLADMKRVQYWIQNILRMGAYQILYMDKVPDSAACDEAVKMCKAYGFTGLQGFVNATLRNVSRNKEKLLTINPSMSDAEKLSFEYSFPLWLSEKWIDDYGLKTAEAIMKPMEDDDGITVRVNTNKISTDNLKYKFLQTGIDVQDGFHMKEALHVFNIGDIEENLFFQQGLLTVQSESSILDTHVVDPQPGENILDVCSSPGGKAIHMAERMLEKGQITALDVHLHRVDLIRQNIKRMKAEIIQPVAADAAVFHTLWENYFDRVLVDAPCSGLGNVHKKPDIKLNITQKSLEELPALQKKILDVCCKYVKLGGVLVYSTCTINPAENQNVILNFINEHPNFQLDDLSPYLPNTLLENTKDGMIQLIPSKHQMDGFFISRMRRVD